MTETIEILKKRLDKIEGRIEKAINEIDEVMEYAFYSTTSDPSDGFSNHWSNAPKEEKKELSCPVCGETENIVDDTPDGMKDKKLYICESCGNWFEIEN